MPRYPSDPDEDAEAPIKYHPKTLDYKYIYDYAGIRFEDQQALYYSDYLMLLRDAYIWRMNQTTEGRKHLYECWLLEQTAPDKDRLRSRFGKEE